MVNLSLFYHHFGGIYHHGLRLAASNISTKVRRVPQSICRQFTDHCWEFADSAGIGFVESTDNLPIFARNLPILALAELPNPSINHRRIGAIHRSGCRNRSVESSDNRQMFSGKRKIAPFLDRPSGMLNRKVIVNRFAVIVNPAAWNLSPIHHQNTEIYHLAPRWRNILFPESSDNHPTKRRNHPTGSANRPKINRKIAESTDHSANREQLAAN
jgi:hypothetical protein